MVLIDGNSEEKQVVSSQPSLTRPRVVFMLAACVNESPACRPNPRVQFFPHLLLLKLPYSNFVVDLFQISFRYNRAFALGLGAFYKTHS